MENTLPPNAMISAAREQVSCDVRDEVAILSLKDGIYYGLNPVGARVWSLIQKPRALRDIEEAILAEFDVEPSRWADDLRRLLRDLADHGLVEITNG
jgi:hypothetical protein